MGEGVSVLLPGEGRGGEEKGRGVNWDSKCILWSFLSSDWRSLNISSVCIYIYVAASPMVYAVSLDVGQGIASYPGPTHPARAGWVGPGYEARQGTEKQTSLVPRPSETHLGTRLEAD